MYVKLTATVDAPLIAAGSLAVMAAAIHGGVGEVHVVRTLLREPLPPTRLGGPRATAAMVHVTWHLTTVAFLAVGCALLLSATVLDGDAAHAVALVAAASATGFAAIAVGLGVATGSVRALLRHAGPGVLTATAALAWWGAL
jgi:hypothetical protein